MRIITVVLVTSFLTGTGLLMAQGRLDAGSSESGLQGTVVDSYSRTPLPDVRISVFTSEASRSASPHAAAISDSRGAFSLPGLGPGRYTLRAEGNSVLPEEILLTVPGPGATPAPPFRLQMIRPATIQGFVFDEAGNGIANASITLLESRYVNGRSFVGGATQGPGLSRRDLSAKTDESGAYRFNAVAPGEYYLAVKVQRSSAAITGTTANHSFPTVYYPNAINTTTATPISIRSGLDVRNADVHWRKVATVTVRGRAIGVSENTPVTYYLMTPEGERVGLSTARNMTFEFRDIPPGSYQLTATARDQASEPLGYAGSTRFDAADSDLDSVEIQLHPPADIVGRILPAPGLSNSDLSKHRISVKYSSVDGQLAGGASGYSVVKPDGVFVLRHMAAIDWRLTLSEGFLVRAKYGSVDLASTFNPGQELGATLQLTVGFQTGSVAGTVVDVNHVPSRSSFVTLVPNNPSLRELGQYLTASSDMTGHFSFSNVPLGDYRIFAWTAIAAGAYTDPNFLRLYESQGRSVRVDAVETVDNIEVTIIVPH